MKKIIFASLALICFSIQANACMTILCEAVCAKYKPMTETMSWGKNSEVSNDYFQLVNSRAVYIDGEKSFTEIFDKLKAKCSGANEVLFAANTKPAAKLTGSADNISPSQVCKRIEGPSSANNDSEKTKKSGGAK